MDWSKCKKILVTGGASFIGSHLVDKLLERGVKIVRVVDNLSSGKQENIQKHIDSGRVEFYNRDLLCPHIAPVVVHECSIVFHLAADHGGRGYVDLHNAQCSTNLILDGLIIKAAKETGVEKFIFASSGCIYPNYLQTDTNEKLYLTENMISPYDADNLYGWAKLMGEMTLKAYYKQYGMRSVSCRLFTVYGIRGVENHAVMAIIARAFTKSDPFEIWGSGNQIRNWTYVDDIAEGMILAAEKIDDARAINLGTMERISVIDAVKETLKYIREKSEYYPMFMDWADYKPELKFLPDMPTGPLNRVADNSLAKELLDWEPEMKFIDGLHRTIDWYFQNKNKKEVQKILNKKLLTEKL